LAQSKKKTKTVEDSSKPSLLVKNGYIWAHTGFTKGSILIEQGRIRRIAKRIDSSGFRTIDATGLCVLPGLIDVHVHLRDLELAYKEDFASGTAAAAAGGFTTVLDMPNTVPPTDTPTRMREKQRIAAKKCYVNVGFHAAATAAQRTIAGLSKAGAFSLKLYMPKPIAPFNVSNNESVRDMMENSANLNLPITVHAEDLSIEKGGDPENNFQDLADIRSPSTESSAVERISSIQRKTRSHVHYCHLTLASSLEALSIRNASTEVTPHHLLLSRKHLRKLGWKAWMVPPLRSDEERLHLLSATRNGKATVIASDHAPHTISEKMQSPAKCPPGVPGLETSLSLMLTLVHRGQFTISQLVALLAGNPAKIFRLRTKGTLRPGSDADVTLVDLRKKGKIDSSKFQSKAKFSPFDGFRTIGSVDSTIVGGKLVFHEGGIVSKQGCGTVIRSSLVG
jgi:dihydroorotase